VASRVRIRPVAESDRAWVARNVAERFASSRVVSRGVLHDALRLDGLIAVRGEARCGVLLYAIRAAECEVVVLISVAPGSGAASDLLAAVQDIARDSACRRLWLITTNDNDAAIDFYRRRGWALKAVHENAVAEARRLKPEIPHVGRNGVPIRDELEFELLLPAAGAR
jgi:ribosomal protein S18 acetylase RimI-like enzyme